MKRFNVLKIMSLYQAVKNRLRSKHFAKKRGIPTAVLAFFISALTILSVQAIPTTHELTGNWVGNPTSVQYGSTLTAEWRVNTNDANNPPGNNQVDNVRVTLVATNALFTSIPGICKSTGVTPVSSISADKRTLVCNLGTTTEGTSTVVQAAVRADNLNGGNVSISGTATSDSAVSPAGPVILPPIPTTYTHGMDLKISTAPAAGLQGQVTGNGAETRQHIKMNFSLYIDAGSRPGPASYSFPVQISSAGLTTGMRFESCSPVSRATSPSTGHPSSTSTDSDRTNFPGCAVTGSGLNYTVNLTGLDYTLQRVPVKDSLGNTLPTTEVYVASGTIDFSFAGAVSSTTTYNFNVPNAPAFTFDDGTTLPDPPGDNSSVATVIVRGGFGNNWAGTPANGRNPWDDRLFVSPGNSTNMPIPGGNSIPLHMSAASGEWRTYTGAGGAQMAGMCTMAQNPNFVLDKADFGAFFNGYTTLTTGRIFYTTQTLNTKTETCGQAAPSAMWQELIPPAGSVAGDPRSSGTNLVTLPAGVTALKLTWNPAVDKHDSIYLRGFGHISPSAPVPSEAWTVGSRNGPSFGWTNGSETQPTLVATPWSTYAAGTNAFRDVLRIQGNQGVITKDASDTTAEAGEPITYTINAQAQSFVTSPPPANFTVTDTLPAGMEYISGTGSPVPVVTGSVGTGQTLTWTFSGVPVNVNQTITYQARVPVGSTLTPGTSLTNTATIDLPGDTRPVDQRRDPATVTVPSTGSTSVRKASADNVLSYYGDTSSWNITIQSSDPVSNPFTDTIDILPYKSDGRGTNIDGTYTITSVNAPAGSTVYYTTAPSSSLSNDPRNASNGGTPGSVTGNTVGWSTTPVANPTAIRVIGPALPAGGTQTIAINYSIPTGTSCASPAAPENKPNQVLVNSVASIADHTNLPMTSSASARIGDCYALDVKKYVLQKGGNPAVESDWHDANVIADYQRYNDGDQPPYRIIVTNKGSNTISNITVDDSLFPSCDRNIPSLAAGASQTIFCTGTVTYGTTINTAQVTATPPEGPPLNVSDPAGVIVELFKDHGDAPDSYSTLSGSGGPVHNLLGYDEITVTSPLMLGSSIDGEADGLPGAAATGDDVTDAADEDAVSTPVYVIAGQITNVNVTATNNTTQDATLAGWIDLNGNGTFETGERVIATVPANSGTASYPLSFPAGTTVTNTYSRFRIMPGIVANPLPTGTINGGEIEDHLAPAGRVRYQKTVSPMGTNPIPPGSTFTYTITVSNVGNAPLTGLTFNDDLSQATDDAVYNNDANATIGSTSYNSGTQTLTWNGNLDIGQTATITYTMTANNPITGDAIMLNVVTGNGPGTNCPAPTPTDPNCMTRSPQPNINTQKTLVSPAAPEAGDTVSYQFTVTNNGAAAAAGLIIADSLAGVLDDAAYNNDAAASIGTVSYDATNQQVVWQGDLAASGDPGDSVTVTFTVTINAADSLFGDGVLRNAMLSADCPVNPIFDPSDPGYKASCVTVTPIKAWTVVKTSTPSGRVNAGGTVEYTVTVTNTGGADLAGTDTPSINDDLTNVLDDAVFNNDEAATIGTVSFTSPNITWSGALNVGQSSQITYSVTVKAPDALANGVLNNAVTGGTCPTPAVTNSNDPGFTADCVQIHDIAAWTVAKTSSAGSSVMPGDFVTYTVTITNTGQADLTGLSIQDNLTNVLDDATYMNDLATSLGQVSYAQPTITWQGDLTVGQSSSVTYSVQVNPASAAGDGFLQNAVTGGTCPTPAVTNPGDPGFNPDCVIITPVREWIATKTANPAGVTDPGAVIDYTITVKNTGGVDLGGPNTPSITDDLTEVLDDAVYNNDETATTGTPTYADPTLSWSGALNRGATADINYSITVNDKANLGDGLLANAVLGSPNCPSPAVLDPNAPNYVAECAPRVAVAAYNVTKTSNPANGSEVQPGQTVNYTLTIENLGASHLNLNNFVLVDNLADVLDDAMLVGNPTVSPSANGTASIAGSNLTFNGDVPVGQATTVTYTVRVKPADQLGNRRLHNVVTAAHSDCANAAMPWCETSHPVRLTGGLAGTGQNILTFIAISVTLLIGAGIFWRMQHRRFNS